MGEYLPGNLQERLRELREKNGYSTRQELAEVLGIDKSTYGRIESGNTKTINSDLLVQLSELYNVSTDYILGLSDVPQKTYFDLKELGLSVEAAENLLSKDVDQRVVNELLLNDRFMVATRCMGNYFSNVSKVAFESSDAIHSLAYDMAIEMGQISKYKKDKSLADLRKKIRANKIPAKPYELEQIKMHLMAAVSEIKSKVDGEIQGFCVKTFSSEAFESIKKGIMENEGFMDLPMSERMDFLIKQLQMFMHEKGGIPEDKVEDFDEAIAKILPMLADLYK